MFFMLLLLKPCLSCVCEQRERLDLQVTSSYDVVFFGKVLGVTACDEGDAVVKFKVTELYKGNVGQECELSFLCGKEDCSGDFQIDTEWLIFTDFNNAQECVFELCSHSRELIDEEHAQYVDQERGSTFFQDHAFLKSNFEVKTRFQNELTARRYEKVDPDLIPVFLGVSLLFMVVGVFVFRRVGKK